jgi:hypothetical protein
MPRLSLGLYQKKFLSTSRVSGPAINMGCTKGRGSTTRMFNYCNQRSPNPSECINQFITITEGGSDMPSGPENTVPGAPIITFIVPGDQELIINFSAPSDGGSSISDYLYSINGGISFTSSGFTSSPITITGLLNNVPYQISIKAVNSIGAGNASNTVSGTPSTTNQGWSELGNFTSLYTTTGTIRVVNYNQTLNKVYAAGDFTNSGGYQFVAVYDITSNVWSELGNINPIIGAVGSIRALVFDTNNDVYIGGDFRNQSNGVVFVAKYTNSTGQWSELGNLANNTAMSVSGSINCLSSDSQNRIYAAGNFQYNDGTADWRYVAIYTPGSNTWDRIPNPNNFSIGGQQFNGELYVITSRETSQGVFIQVAGDAIATNGGVFDNPVGVRRVWTYLQEFGGFLVDGAGQWPTGSGVNPQMYMFNGPVYALSDQFAGGAFTSDQNITAQTNSYILARAQWQPYPLTFNGGFSGPTYNGPIRTISNSVYIAGDFTNNSGNPYVAYSYDGSQLGNQPTFFNASILSLSSNPSFGRIYAGGSFTNSSGKNFVAIHIP